MRWLGIAGVLLLMAGLLTPLFGPILGRNFGQAAFALTVAGLILFGLSALYQRIRGNSDLADGSSGDASGTDSPDSRDSHEGGHGGEGDH